MIAMGRGRDIFVTRRNCFGFSRFCEGSILFRRARCYTPPTVGPCGGVPDGSANRIQAIRSLRQV
jgi:hypothetical protein